jgi:hypothetical protein
MSRKDAEIWRLLDILIEQPVLNADYIIESLQVSRRSAYNIIDTAIEAKIIHKIGNRVRGVFYEAKDVTGMLDLICSDDGLRRISAR